MVAALIEPVDQPEQLDRVFGALADPTRRTILARLSRGDAAVNDLVALFDLSQPTISRHLQVLERAGLVTRGREAQFRPVRLEAEGLAGAARWLGDYRGFWEESLERLDEYVAELGRNDDSGEAR